MEIAGDLVKRPSQGDRITRGADQDTEDEPATEHDLFDVEDFVSREMGPGGGDPTAPSPAGAPAN